MGFKKLKEILFKDNEIEENEELDDFFSQYKSLEERLKEEKSKYKIDKLNAYWIACEDENLKNDYVKKDKRLITYISFTDCKIKLIHHQNQPYWFVKITAGDISWAEEDTFYDGFFSEEELKELQCYINANTGEYIYYENLK